MRSIKSSTRSAIPHDRTTHRTGSGKSTADSPRRPYTGDLGLLLNKPPPLIQIPMGAAPAPPTAVLELNRLPRPALASAVRPPPEL